MEKTRARGSTVSSKKKSRRCCRWGGKHSFFPLFFFACRCRRQFRPRSATSILTCRPCTAIEWSSDGHALSRTRGSRRRDVRGAHFSLSEEAMPFFSFFFLVVAVSVERGKEKPEK